MKRRFPLHISRAASKRARMICVGREYTSFTEKPSDSRNGNGNSNQSSAHDLFNAFTADVIRERKIFTR
ncbi:hypothetical protein [Sediminibacterium ginsengisoli]|uniref:Uncharacterized protein n=1 Tax=Sediminibacterium ginsengisoli TaxID=413434 RepID=A0A1T4Q4B5_9BACT|nr:hypothetical protein [Sediminibacterium ginsengisoli]SJZ98068.1 hypothetical protein SAMN04488132_107117 [Sediminibacterium ginsengisoli]